MSIFQKSGISTFTRGGQTTLHFIRMIAQVLSKFSMLVAIVFVAGAWLTIMNLTTSYERYVTFKHGVAYITLQKLKRPSVPIPFRLENGEEVRLQQSRLLVHPSIIAIKERTYRAVVWGIVIGVFSAVLILILTARLVYRFGAGQAKDEHVRGTQLVGVPELRRMVKRRRDASDLCIGTVPIPKHAELEHILFGGSPGTGKTRNYLALLKQIRKRKERAIVYDVPGEFVSHFYRPGRDVILNPMDERGVSWDIWRECRNDYDYDQVATSLIPDSQKGDPFWVLGARNVFATITRKLSTHPDRCNRMIVDAIMRLSIDDIIDFLRNTEAAAVISKGGERMATSVRAVAAAYARSLKYLPDHGQAFSIREWVEEDDGDGWIFISSKANQKAAARPLVTAWLDIASSSIMSLPPDNKRRIWTIIDELPSLNKLIMLNDALAQQRKYGGAMVIGFQSFSQMIDIYGEHGAHAIADACGTWAIMRFNGDKSAEWASKGLGSSETLETSEGISYGGHEIRDGVSLSKNRKMRPIVLPTEINDLPDLQGYLKYGRNYPRALFKLRYLEYPVVAPGFVDRSVVTPVSEAFVAESLVGQPETPGCRDITNEVDPPNIEADLPTLVEAEAAGKEDGMVQEVLL